MCSQQGSGCRKGSGYMKKQFAFILMGSAYDPACHQARFETEAKVTHIRTVRDMEEAGRLARQLADEGVGAIELCGAFGKEGAAKITQITGGKIAVGYVVHEPEQDPLFAAFFGN